MVAATKQWSEYQQAIFEFGANGTGSAMVNAVAGSGKTTTIEEMARRMNPAEPILYLVFNKRNATEAQERMPGHVNASTFHSACNSALSRRLNRPRIDANKIRGIIREGCDHGAITAEEFQAWANDIARLVGLAKNAGIDCLIPDTVDSWWSLIEHHDIEFDDIGDGDPTTRAIEIAQRVLQISNKDLRFIDFDDMLYLVVKLNVSLPTYNVVCVDEAQDTNAIQRAILQKVLNPGGKLIAVGDPRQAIYGFRGASADAMELIAQQFDAISLPLSVNYRCSKAVIVEAQTICPEIQAHDAAPGGSVNNLTELDLKTLTSSDAVLCRTTAPIITLAYRAIGQGIPCTVLGREIGQGLIALVKKLQGRRSIAIDELQVRLEEYGKREISKLLAKGQDTKAQAIDDKVQSLYAAINALPEDDRTVTQLIQHIESLFSDNGNGRLTLATVHKSKGLEWDNVYILNRHEMPSKWARKDWQRVQEQNLIYVATTRAKINLYTIALEAVK